MYVKFGKENVHPEAGNFKFLKCYPKFWQYLALCVLNLNSIEILFVLAFVKYIHSPMLAKYAIM
jgi:hypothetical protein